MGADNSTIKLSRLTIGFGIFIIFSASFARNVLNFLYGELGRNNLQISIGLVFIFIGILFIIHLFKSNLSKPRISIIIIIFLMGLFVSGYMEIVEERVHILEYGLLGWFSTSDAFRKNTVKNFAFCISFVFFIGIIDEIYQWILPSRIGDIRDVLFNVAGGLWGVAQRTLKS